MQYDIAHAKALGWRHLRAKQAQSEREAAEGRRKAKKAKKAKSAESSQDDTSSEDTETDPEDEDWDAICAIGLKVFSRDPKLELEVKLSPELNYLLNESSETSTLDDSESRQNGL